MAAKHPKKSRFWFYLTPSIVTFSISLVSPLWYCVRIVGAGFLLSLATLIFGAISLSTAMDTQKEKEKKDQIGQLDEYGYSSPAAPVHDGLGIIKFSGAAFIATLAIFIPTLIRIIYGWGEPP